MVMEALTTVLEPHPQRNFVETPFVRGILERAMTYLAAGFPIHFRGASGTGKTTLAFHVAANIGRPVVMIHGDEEFSTSDLVGGEYGYRTRKVIDNFVHSVLKTEEDESRRWVDNRLTVACRNGFTLIYDEFTRSRPEANNALLAVLQEKMLDLPAGRQGESYLRVHPDFRAIFTSNPEEYAGVYRSQDALRDRMVTLDLDFFDEETEIDITCAKAGISRPDAETTVRIVRELRQSGICEFAPTVRACIMIAKALHVRHNAIGSSDGLFKQLCVDILTSGCSRVGNRVEADKLRGVVCRIVDKCLALESNSN